MVLKVLMDDDVEEHECPECGRPFRRVSGALLDDERAAGLYSADLHYGRHRTAVLAIGAPDADGRLRGVTLNIRDDGDQLSLSFRDPIDDEWFHSRFGRLLTRAEALKDPMRDHFFHLSDHIDVSDIRVRRHFEERDA
jgi:hypothetical protein